MCCFSKRVEFVTDTDIFARASKEGRQYLVYAMRFKAGEDLAMILPLPVPKDVKEDAVKFINLEKKGNMKVHPMAFEFPRADASKLFFPTVHIHDGKAHAKASFDHMLFCQTNKNDTVMDWQESTQPAGMFMKDIDKAEGIVDPQAHCFRKKLKGMLENKDTLV